jgi:hypothetical protein
MKCGYSITFLDIYKMSKVEKDSLQSSILDDRFVSSVAHELQKADRDYLLDNLDPFSEGNYLDDFLKVHGDEIASPIKFLSGSSHCVGRGIVFLDAEKIREKFNEFLKQSSLEDLYAAMSATNMVESCEKAG